MRKLLILPLLALSACVPTPADKPGTVDEASDSTEATGDEASDSTEATGDGASDSTEATGDGASDSTEATGDGASDSTEATGDGASDPAEAIAALRAHVEELEARAEHDEQQIEVQHILISFGNKVPGAARTQEAAEQLAADLYAQIQDGADFDALVREHTDDSHPGIYGMHQVGSQPSLQGSMPRSGMVAAFGDVGWRLPAAGEVGVAAFHRTASPYGWHIVMRTR